MKTNFQTKLDKLVQIFQKVLYEDDEIFLANMKTKTWQEMISVNIDFVSGPKVWAYLDFRIFLNTPKTRTTWIF